MMKVCTKCKRDLPKTQFHSNKRSLDGLKFRCIPCRNEDARGETRNMYDTKRRETKEYKEYHDEYHITKRRIIKTAYRNMKKRVEGKTNRPNYKGLDILDENDFYSWSINDTEFNRIHDECDFSSTGRANSPSIDRIDPTKGYTIDNMRWLTVSDNNRARHGTLEKK